MAASTHQVRQRPPLRALALSAILMFVGIMLVLMAQLLDSNVALLAVGLVVVALGFALFAASAWVARAMRVHVVLDEDGYVLQGRDATEAGKWSDVGRVTRGRDRITLHHRDGTRVQLVVARSAGADLDALGADIAEHLDANRGYGA
ncbi:MAG: hypothetical protein KDB60_02370 [Propionibacteriaceae bacterium]|nr:hypothetical protein [Propionibacteriaceae bacterium]